jgi:ribosomal protein L37AE/L43A
MAVYDLDQAPQDVLEDVNRHGPHECPKCNTLVGVKLEAQKETCEHCGHTETKLKCQVVTL